MQQQQSTSFHCHIFVVCNRNLAAMKFKKYQTMFALGTPWQDDVVNYAELKKLIYSHVVVIPAADSPPSPVVLVCSFGW
jgi:hypothetical protein